MPGPVTELDWFLLGPDDPPGPDVVGPSGSGGGPVNITGSVGVNLIIDEGLVDGLSTGSLGLSESPLLPFVTGTLAGQCDLDWSAASTLAAGASDTWTLSALVDQLGRTVALARFNILLIETNATVDGDDLTVGGAATNPVTSVPTYLVKSMGFDLKVALNSTGFIVSAGSADQLKVTNSGSHPITYRIALAGRSA